METAAENLVHRSGNLTDKHLDGVWVRGGGGQVCRRLVATHGGEAGLACIGHHLHLGGKVQEPQRRSVYKSSFLAINSCLVFLSVICCISSLISFFFCIFHFPGADSSNVSSIAKRCFVLIHRFLTLRCTYLERK